MTERDNAAVEAQKTDKDEFPEMEVSDKARPGDVTPPMQPVDGPPYEYPPGDANAPHANTEWGEGRRAKAADARNLGERFGQRAERERVLSEEIDESDHEPTRAELMDRASELGIKGRSSMNKDELADAIAEAEEDN